MISPGDVHGGEFGGRVAGSGLRASDVTGGRVDEDLRQTTDDHDSAIPRMSMDFCT